MPEKIYVGTGGWYDYKKDSLSPGLRLKAYSKKFTFVEVNSTFYKIFHPKTLERWRRNVPEDFEFSVKCYKALTHKIGIRPVEDAFRVFNLMKQYCKILDAKVLIMETPTSLKLDDKFVIEASLFFNSVSLENVRIAWEFRRKPDDLPNNLVRLMQDFNIIHIVDITWENPRYVRDILYTRIFGNPRKEFLLSNEDAHTVESNITESKSRIAYVSIHTPKMVQDAKRLNEMLSS